MEWYDDELPFLPTTPEEDISHARLAIKIAIETLKKHLSKEEIEELLKELI